METELKLLSGTYDNGLCRKIVPENPNDSMYILVFVAPESKFPEHLVSACNSHEALLEACLELARSRNPDHVAYAAELAEAAIAEAEA